MYDFCLKYSLRYNSKILVVLFYLFTCPVQASERRVTPEMVGYALTQQGYEIVTQTRTLLGRIRFVASLDMIWREVVLDLSTGQIIRDYAVEFTPTTPPDLRRDTMPRGGTVLPGMNIPDLVN